MRLLNMLSVASSMVSAQYEFEDASFLVTTEATTTIEPPTDVQERRRKKKKKNKKKRVGAPEKERKYSNPKFRRQRNTKWNPRWEKNEYQKLEKIHNTGMLVDIFSEQYKRPMTKLSNRLETLRKMVKADSEECWANQASGENRNALQRYPATKQRIDRWTPKFDQVKEGLYNYFEKFAVTIRESFGKCDESAAFHYLNKLDYFRLKTYFRFCTDFPGSLPICNWVTKDSQGNPVSRSTHGSRPFKLIEHIKKYQKNNAAKHATKFGLKQFKG
ncbi:Oidioi.mRNA.OKI2018_I69.XSR.g14299.t1.cds [Oikopleura dioica]|uniref:Oidioi.mRNA.OKI2018_I69.XSR.g14299.t1.cds n=1 Tax=Oikopleura dioica TaxID=34765 RepID=A0ABN7SI89_OIKDI|nr:Oidioi.mRNA.OKI2018_I69.XSR.g14299.t1.cds [Oikopleura dioica]